MVTPVSSVFANALHGAARRAASFTTDKAADVNPVHDRDATNTGRGVNTAVLYIGILRHYGITPTPDYFHLLWICRGLQCSYAVGWPVGRASGL